MNTERRLEELGLTLPAAAALPPGVEIPFAWVRVHDNRAFVSGHGAFSADGSPAVPFGKLPSEVTLEEAQHSTRLATLAVLASLKTALGDLDRTSCKRSSKTRAPLTGLLRTCGRTSYTLPQFNPRDGLVDRAHD